MVMKYDVRHVVVVLVQAQINGAWARSCDAGIQKCEARGVKLAYRIQAFAWVVT